MQPGLLFFQHFRNPENLFCRVEPNEPGSTPSPLNEAQLASLNAALQTYKNAQTGQTGAIGQASGTRIDRNSHVEQATERRLWLHFAADAEWTHTDPANTPIRFESTYQTSNRFTSSMKIALVSKSCVLLVGTSLVVACNRSGDKSPTKANDSPPATCQERSSNSPTMEQKGGLETQNAYENGLELILSSEKDGDAGALHSGRILLESAANNAHLPASFILARTYLRQRAPSIDEINAGLKWLQMEDFQPRKAIWGNFIMSVYM